MTDAGYSSEYELYLTHRNGVQIVTNELSLHLLDEMRARSISPSETAAIMHLPKSTIQGNLGKLQRMGIIAQDVCEDDARSAVYRIVGRLLFRSRTESDWQRYARAASVTRIMTNGRCTPREDLSLYGVSLMESGFNITLGLFHVGGELTRGITDRAWWDRLIASLKARCPKDVTIDFDSIDSLNLSFKSEQSDISDIPLIIVPLLGALAYHSKEFFGYRLSQDIRLSVEDSGRSIKFRVGRYRGQDFVDDKGIIESYVQSESFSIYSIDGKAMMFTNATMMGVLDALFEKDLSLGELEDVMGISKATIYAAATKLMSMGAIKIDPNSGSPKKYTLVADPILYMTDPGDHSPATLSRIVADFQAGRMDYYSAVIAYALEVIGCLGIHFDKMFMRAGKNTALTVLGMRSKITAQEMVDLACDMISGPDRAEVVSYLPIDVRVDLSKNTLWDAWPPDFVMGFLTEGLFYLLGHNYPIKVEVYREGEKKPVSVMESSQHRFHGMIERPSSKN